MQVAIASGKGGTGKTTVSVNLSAYLARSHTVTLCDLDVEEPNTSLFLPLHNSLQKEAFKQSPSWERSECTLCRKCADICAFNAIVALPEEILVFDELCHSCYACSELCPQGALPMQDIPIGTITSYKSHNIDCVEGRLNLGQEMAVPLISQTIDFAKKHNSAQIKIFDAPPGTSCPVLEAAKHSDLILLVTEPTPFGLNDLQLAIESMGVLDKPFGVIINRANTAENIISDYCKDNGIRVVTAIAHDKALAKLYSKGELLYEKSTDFHKNMQAIESFIKEYA